ncbi:uncharacterized protein LOC129586507 isoform X1 [Paramacrobiotus metropolitanus]|uniref:uncharacterized protein LOC129586507 isoform X1 n=1 Tax=Paramacrobiotus metropolitanus TaxID=2943436 RepID=UPI0024458C86|nr:uncharacterized protein LOC129586507 isoform X1 [Paramacrobiotus metropolitanus]
MLSSFYDHLDAISLRSSPTIFRTSCRQRANKNGSITACKEYASDAMRISHGGITKSVRLSNTRRTLLGVHKTRKLVVIAARSQIIARTGLPSDTQLFPLEFLIQPPTATDNFHLAVKIRAQTLSDNSQYYLIVGIQEKKPVIREKKPAIHEDEIKGQLMITKVHRTDASEPIVPWPSNLVLLN